MGSISHQYATVSSSIEVPCEALSKDAIIAIKSELTLSNPDYNKLVRLGKKGWGVPKTLKFYDVDDDYLYIPRGCAWLLQKFAPLLRYADKRSACKPEFSGFEIPLRDYQKKAIDTFCACRQGFIVVPCGGGKTRIALGCIARLGLKALVLVHTKDLQTQWEKNAAELNIPLEVRLIQSCSEGSLPAHDFLILDEAHHVAASTFREVVALSDARYRLGLTATPEREDGLTKVLSLYFGNKIFEITHKELVDGGFLVVPKIRRIWTNIDTNFDYSCNVLDDYPKMVSLLCADEERNALIVRTVVQAVSDGSVGLVLANRIDQCHALADAISAQGVPAFALTSEENKIERARRLEAAGRGEIRILCATTLADEGLDLPILSKVFLAYPSRAVSRTTQRLGRIMRPYPGKGRPVLYDFVDPVGPFVAQARKRMSLYRKILGADCNI